jgi:predicted acylesterase/phospholipase RssA
MALPVVYGRVVRVQGVPYIDGGVTDAIPLAPALGLAPARLSVVATRPLGYRKQPAPWLVASCATTTLSFPRSGPRCATARSCTIARLCSSRRWSAPGACR